MKLLISISQLGKKFSTFVQYKTMRLKSGVMLLFNLTIQKLPGLTTGG